MLIKTVPLDPGTPWRVDTHTGVVFLSTLLSPEDAPLHLRDALEVLHPREEVVRLRLVG